VVSTPVTSSIGEPTALALRPYQTEAIAAIEQALKRGVRRPMLVLPTGCGKTCVFASLIAKRGGSAGAGGAGGTTGACTTAGATGARLLFENR